MRLTKRGMVWWVDFRLADGRRRRLTTGETERGDADKAAQKIVAAAMSANDVATLGNALDRQYREHWSTTKSASVIRHTVNVLTREIGAWSLRDCTYVALRGYCERLKSAGLAPATINRRMSAVSVTLRECSRRGECDRPDMPHFTENNRRERYMSDGEERAVFRWLERKVESDRVFGSGEWAFVRSLFVVLVDTGIRFSEAFKARKDGRVLVLFETKNGKPRYLPLTARAATHWRWLSSSEHYTRLCSDPNAWAWVDHRWKQAVAGGGCPDITLHTLRHTCASRLIQRGVDLYTVSRWLGHSSMKVTERYAHLAPEALTRALSALEGTLDHFQVP